jgi:hypothetical protein
MEMTPFEAASPLVALVQVADTARHVSGSGGQAARKSWRSMA